MNFFNKTNKTFNNRNISSINIPFDRFQLAEEHSTPETLSFLASES